MIPAGNDPACENTDASAFFEDVNLKVKQVKRPEVTNGGSLEDCVSNIYPLLELPGIKWKCFRPKPNAPRGLPLTSDNVIKAYSRCVQNGILCTWRRKQLNATGNNDTLPLPHFSNSTPKELWVFWYDDEPADLAQFCEGLDSDEELSSANQMNIVSYEVRTILFKALHVVLERDLTKDGFVRFGRWFTIPFKARESHLHFMYPTHSSAIRLNFFVHGASTVFASVQAQRQPTLLTLAKRHLEFKPTKSPKRLSVIVGPWSMRGILIQDQLSILAEPQMQEAAETEWEHWKEYLQMEEKEPEVVADVDRQKSPGSDSSPIPPPHTTRVLLADSSDEELSQTQNFENSDENSMAKPDEIPEKPKYTFEPTVQNVKPKEPVKVETPEEREKRFAAREVRRKRRRAREEKRLEAEKAFHVTGLEESDTEKEGSDVDIEDPAGEIINDEVPKMVLLEIDGVRMLYPSKFICVTLEDDRQILEASGVKMNPAPQELQVQGGRGNLNRHVVHVGNPIFSAMAVYQYVYREMNSKIRTKIDYKSSIPKWFYPLLPYRSHYIDKKGTRKLIEKPRWSKEINPIKDMGILAYHRKRYLNNNKSTPDRLDRGWRMKYEKQPAWLQRTTRKCFSHVHHIDDSFRADSEDEAYQMDKLCQKDWANFEEEPSKEILDFVEPEKEVEVNNEVQIAEPTEPDETYKPRPFVPITVVNPKKTGLGEYESKSGDEDMSEERFNEVFKDKDNLWKPEMTRLEKMELASYSYDPYLPPAESPRPYHLTEFRKKYKCGQGLRVPKNNKYYNGESIKNGLIAFNKMWAIEDAKHRKEKRKFLKKHRRLVCRVGVRFSRRNHLIRQKQIARRSIARAVRKLRISSRKDNLSESKFMKALVDMTVNTKPVETSKEVDETTKLQEALDRMDVNSTETIGPSGQRMFIGYIPPDYESHTEEESDQELEERTGLGEGTSVQYADGESMDATETDHEIAHPVMDVRTFGEHVGPDGLLSPPASNEMPKGGPLSVGPPSIESQGLNQIYPTPPSVQMLQGDVDASLKGRCMSSIVEEDVERVAVPGGTALIEEVFEGDDMETKNIAKWNKTTSHEKLSKLLKFSCNDPISRARRKKFDTPLTDKFKIEEEVSTTTAGLVYKSMVSRKFEGAPPQAFGALVTNAARLKKMIALNPASANPHPPQFATPMVPMFQSPVHQHHTPSPQILGHHPMGYPPGTPGPFPPSTPTFNRPGSTFSNPPSYGPGGFTPQRQFMSPQMQMQLRMQQMRQMGPPQGYNPPGYPQGPSSVQRLNNFVYQTQFGPMPVPQSPNFNQNFPGNPMMSPMQQHQYHQQQMHHQMQQSHLRNQQFQQQQLQYHQQPQHPQQQYQHQFQQPIPPTPQMLQSQKAEQLNMAFQQLSERDRRKFGRRQNQLKLGVMPTSLQPAVFKTLKNPPDPNVPYLGKPADFHQQNPHAPEGDSLIIAIILSDTILDLHFDSVFDSCPICSCSVSIRSRDLGMYITPHEVLRSGEKSHSNMREHTVGSWSGFHVNSATNCTCGFSAIRHRYLSCCSGLFPEDANEATTDFSVAPVIPPLNYPKKSTARDMQWFDSKSVHDLALLDQIRQLAFSNSIGKAITQISSETEHNRDMMTATEVGTDITVPTEYVISHVDTLELLMLGNSAIDISMKRSGVRNQNASPQKFLTYFHPWGLQAANEIPELDVDEWGDLLEVVTRSISSSVKSTKPDVLLEGPLTWKEFALKSIRGRQVTDDDEEFSMPEPIPAVMRATAKEAIRTAPNIEQVYEQAGLGPVDEPKDVMYITIIPDDNKIYEQTVKFMDNLTQTYEKMKFGKHIPFPVSTSTATRFREIYKTYQQQYGVQDQNMHQQIVHYTNQTLRSVPPKLADTKKPKVNPHYWEERLKKKLKVEEELEEIEDKTFETDESDEPDEPEVKPFVLKRRRKKKRKAKKEEKPPKKCFEREGILRVGAPDAPTRSHHTVTNTAEFENMTKHIADDTGFVTKLRAYLQQMEDLVQYTLAENPEAFERKGYRYQMAVEGRLKRQNYKLSKEEERVRYGAAKDEDVRLDRQTPPDEEDFPGVQMGNLPPVDWVDDDVEEKKRKKKMHDDLYPVDGHQAPSPVPAGMIHIPETLSEQEKTTQPTLAEILAEPTTVMPLNAQNISWKKRDTSVPNPFPSSNQPPVPFEAIGSNDTDAYSTLPHVIVLYMVNPFFYGGAEKSPLHSRIVILGFIRAFNSIMGKLPYHKRPQLQLEIIGLESFDEVSTPYPDYFNDPIIPFDIVREFPSREVMEPMIDAQLARSLSVAVYTHPRVFFPELYKSVSARCMTAFGPGSQLINTINKLENINKDSFSRQAKRSKTVMDAMDGFRHPGMLPIHQVDKKNFIAYRVPSTIVCLAPPPAVYQLDENGKPLTTPIDEQTLFVSYCLVGTDFLVATATDAQGRLVDNCIANIKPRRQSNQVYRYKHKTQILDGMSKLWTFILGVMSSDIKNWRLVVGRLGRIGHGEFRAWTHLLNKTSLLRYSASLKDICGACRSMPSAIGTPAILSACLITLEPEPSIRIMPELVEHVEGSKRPTMFQTPEDLSCTHILTFPVGAEINLEVQDQTSDTKADENWEFGDLDIMEGLDDGDTEIMKDLGLETPSSAAIRQTGGASMFFSEDSSSIEIQNQPLASGYYISTAPAPELPQWFWSTCPSAKRHNPVHLKSSLHINISEVKNDDIAMESSKEKEKDKDKEEKDIHPLESRQTEEVLRHVLESYNSLSWLNLNRLTGERYSCLPIHIQHLLRLYHSVARLLA